MSTAYYILHSDLMADSNEEIITYDTRSYDAVKQKINLYLTVNSGEVPFSTFGNNLIAQLFYVNDEDVANSIMNNIIDNMNGFLARSGIKIVDYTVGVDRVNRKMNLVLNLSDGNTVTTTI